MVILIVFVAGFLAKTAPPLERTEMFGQKSVLGATTKSAIVNSAGERGYVLRSSSGNAPAQQVPSYPMQVIATPAGGATSSLLVTSIHADKLATLRGRFVFLYEEHPILPGPRSPFYSKPGDCTPLYMIPVSNDFTLTSGESPLGLVFRAAAQMWASASVESIALQLADQMPGVHAPGGPLKRYDASAGEVAESASRLDALRRILVLKVLHQAGYCESEEALEDAIWEVRNNAEVNRIDLPSTGWVSGRRGGEGYLRTSPTEYLVKAEQSRIDSVRAFYVNSLSGPGYDKTRLARLMVASEDLTKRAIVTELGNRQSDPAWHFGKLDPEEQKRRLSEFVGHWRAHYGV